MLFVICLILFKLLNSRCRRGSADILINFDDLYPSNKWLVDKHESKNNTEHEPIGKFHICGKELPRGYWVSFIFLFYLHNELNTQMVLVVCAYCMYRLSTFKITPVVHPGRSNVTHIVRLVNRPNEHEWGIFVFVRLT